MIEYLSGHDVIMRLRKVFAAKPLSATTKIRAYSLGFDAYIDGDYDNPFSRRFLPVARIEKMDDLAHNWSEGFDAAQREARIELRHARSCRYPGC